MAYTDAIRWRLLSQLSEGSAFITIDTKMPGVQVPAYLYGKGSVVLEIGHKMPVPIPDLIIGEKHFSCTLNFKGVPHHCVVPYLTITQITEGSISAPKQPVVEPAKVIDLAAYRKRIKR